MLLLQDTSTSTYVVMRHGLENELTVDITRTSCESNAETKAIPGISGRLRGGGLLYLVARVKVYQI